VLFIDLGFSIAPLKKFFSANSLALTVSTLLICTVLNRDVEVVAGSESGYIFVEAEAL